MLIDGLQKDRIGDIDVQNPLTNEEAHLLREIAKRNRTDRQRKILNEILNEISFENLFRRNGPSPSPKSRSEKLKEAPKYADIIGALKKQTTPAFVADRLWHIHAINGAAFRLFGVNPESSSSSTYLHRWEAWHVLAAKFTNPSPVRDSMVEINRYFPPSVDAFFRDICLFLFTPQARALLSELHTMSKQNKIGFGRMWDSSVSLKSFIRQEEALYRAIVYAGRQIQAIARQRREWTVYPSNDGRYPVIYWMATWEPYDDPAQEVFQELQQLSNSRTIYYAAEYESAARQQNHRVRPFHVNDWPGVVANMLP